ncbi:hypothetical protein [Streptomyces sp. HB2AG]|uniref:hypothetical protein n=1 Tax=Streptomyces sp. HB2AG TaxID=2983400 RepID=UPI0022AA1442|nr:hypothetical protein [Streptomyces sp. HB2AG]MCZ2523353.1 hypothetical protein [Streptomyces sp. HB2AG]
MAKLASSFPPPPAGHPAAPADLSWAFSLGRAPGSDQLAARMTRAALEALGAGSAHGARISHATGLACAHLLAHGCARRYRVALGVDGPRCSVTVTDYGFDLPASGCVGDPVTRARAAGELSRELSAAAEGVRLEDVQVHHARDGAVLVRFTARLPAPGAAAAHTVPGQRTGPDGPGRAGGPGRDGGPSGRG